MKLSDYTPARVGLGVAGESLPTKAQLDFRLAHARARDAVHFPLDAGGLSEEMRACGWTPVILRSSAVNRAEYLRRPDKGRMLSDDSVGQLSGQKCKTAIVVADGLSALAVHRHAVPFLKEMSLGDETALWIVLEGRVAVGDHIGELLHAELSIVILGERPGLTTPDSLGVYLTWAPRVGRTDAERNCISNIHGQGLSYAEAAYKLAFLTNEARRRKLSGVALKETAGNLLTASNLGYDAKNPS
jgi:ethanolamine ammonia-lyase small subunit